MLAPHFIEVDHAANRYVKRHPGHLARHEIRGEVGVDYRRFQVGMPKELL